MAFEVHYCMTVYEVGTFGEQREFVLGEPTWPEDESENGRLNKSIFSKQLLLCLVYGGGRPESHAAACFSPHNV